MAFIGTLLAAGQDNDLRRVNTSIVLAQVTTLSGGSVRGGRKFPKFKRGRGTDQLRHSRNRDFVVDVGLMLSAPEVMEFQVPTAGGKVGFGFQPGEELKVVGTAPSHCTAAANLIASMDVSKNSMKLIIARDKLSK